MSAEPGTTRTAVSPPGSQQRLVLPPAVSRASWSAARDALLDREKAHTREGDAIAAERRRLPMTAVPSATVTGAAGPVPLVDVFEGRRMLIAYFHMWHDGASLADQCEGCTFSTCHMHTLDYLHARDVTYAVFSQGAYEESAEFAAFMGYNWPWYSARDATALLAGRGFGFIACYVRDDEGQVFETYWTTDRGTEALMTSYHALDLTVFGRQERWEASPDGWPRVPAGEHPWRTAGRPVAQWSRLRQIQPHPATETVRSQPLTESGASA
ncbi:DUF899 domain-containing protein [Leekyejoonella antrihumi]|uniref:DUF899 domain-containing protein n=2 Tax=Leekyejoonella antrihumi TaxID=1660198 RepID=A0A563E916_9MICO|nr:DUF899 domain-containing protein [Leekyejoonella antrihumi]